MSPVDVFSNLVRAVWFSALAASVTAAVMCVLAVTVAVLWAYLLGGADAVLGRDLDGFWGMFVVAPIHAAMLRTIGDCLVIGAAVGVMSGVLAVIVYRAGVRCHTGAAGGR